MRPNIARVFALGVAIVAACAAGVTGAPRGVRAETLDRVVAVVGDNAILLSKLEDEITLLKMQETAMGGAASPDSALRARALEQLIDDQLVLAKADQQGITVTEGEIDEALEGSIANMRRQFGSDEAFRAQLAKEGMKEEDLKARYRDEIRNQLKGRRVLDKEVNSKVTVTEDDIQKFYEAHKAEIPTFPKRLELAQIIVRRRASGATRDAAFAKIEDVRAKLANGGNFEELAKEYSEGPSASRGGDLGQFKPTDMEPAFASAVDALTPGEISGPVETRIGVHIIRLDEKREEGVRAHHIIALFNTDASARDSALARMNTALEAIRGGADFGETAKWASDDESTRDKGGRVGLFAMEELPEEYRTVIEPLAPGGISEVLEADDGFLVFKLVSVDEARAPRYEEIKKDLRDAAREEKTAQEFSAWIETLRSEIHVRVL
ncbi:MAG: peptidylprolyl isomerase [bacterium]